jgi:dienelactone hydrolase
MSGFAELLPGTHPKTDEVVDVASLRRFAFAGKREVFQFGEGGPPILATHELPGFTPQFVHFCRALQGEFTVYAPLLFGRVGETASGRNFLRVSASRDWFVLKDATPRIIGELRELAHAINAKHPGQKMGAIGMCFTGQLPAALLDRPFIQAAVLSQPSMPFRGNAKLALDPADVDAAKLSRVPMIAFRFATDDISPPERQARFQEVFGPQIDFQALSAGEKKHAVLTKELFDEQGRIRIGTPAFAAFEKTRDYLRKRLSQ